MIDTRAVAKEVQDQLTAAMQKGQEQIRRTRKNVDAALRTGNHLAQAVKPSAPGRADQAGEAARQRSGTRHPRRRDPAQAGGQRPGAGTQAVARQRNAGNAQEFATQAFAAQRKLTGKALEAASPLLSDGVSRLTQLATSLAPGHRTEHAEPTAPAAVATEPEAAVATEPEPSGARRTKSAARARTPRASTRRTSTAKPASTEEKQAKASTRKTSTAKTSTAKASTTTAKARTPKK